MIPFNKPFLAGKEIEFIQDSVQSGKISGNGLFTKKCQEYFEKRYGFKKTLLTTSCTDALEMAAILLDIQPGDEVIVPSYTFVSSALAFIRQGAKIIFADSRSDLPGIDEYKIEELITTQTKAIVVVHYAGVACNMEKIMQLANQYGIFVIEDAAQAVDSYFKGQPLGGIGHMGTFSFHETKNIIAGEGGMLAINDERFIERSEIIWEKGTNRSAFFKGEIDKYGWVDIGSSFLPSEIIAAFLFAQLEKLDEIQNRRKQIWQLYYEDLQALASKGHITLPYIPEYATNNGHMFYLVVKDQRCRDELLQYLKRNGIHAVFHYISLHTSEYYLQNNQPDVLPQAERFTQCLIRLPFFFELEDHEIQFISDHIKTFFA